MSHKQMLLSVIITFVEKDKEFLRRCIESIKKSARSSRLRLELIIIANGAQLERNTRYDAKFKIIINKKNLGFGRAINQGMKLAKGKWCIILAPDTIVELSTLKYLLPYTNDYDVAIIGPKIVFPDGKLDFSIIAPPTLWNMFLEHSYLYKILPFILNHPYSNEKFYRSTHRVNGLASTFWLIRKKYFYLLDGFDPRFFLFFDDTDLCKRIIDKDWKIIFEPKSEIIHYAHQSSGGIKRGDLFLDGLYKYLTKHYSMPYAHLGCFLLFLGSLIRLAYWNMRTTFTFSKQRKEFGRKKIIFCKQVIKTFPNIISLI